MICNQTEGGWDIIFQRAHALLAAQLAANWRSSRRPERWLETLTAIAQHDNGWQEWEAGDRLTEEGTPLDFTQMSLAQIALQAQRAVTRAWHQSLWSGLLVSRHISHLYEPRRGEYNPLDELLGEQRRLRRRWRRWLDVSREAEDEGYALLLWADTLSLILCQHRLPSGGSKVEIGAGPEGERYELRQRADDSLSLSPWPYEMHRFHVEVEVHHLRQRTFPSDDTLTDALEKATVTRQRWELWTK